MSLGAIVIGAGANGLVAATVMARAGLRVTVLERAPVPGGQGAVVEFAPGFRAAPLAVDPGWLPAPVAEAAGITGLEPVGADTPLSVAAEPGRFLTLARDPARATDALRAWSPADAARWPDFAARLHRLAGFLGALYTMPAPDVDAQSPGELLALAGLGRRFRGLGRADMTEFLRALPISVAELLDDAFECVPLKAAVAAGGIVDHRQGPRSGATGFVLLHHLVGAPLGAVRGRTPWRAGPDAFTAAAADAAKRAGVTVRAGAPVARIQVRDDAVRGVVLEDGGEIAAPIVLSTAAPARTLLDWVDPVWLDPEFLHAVSNVRHRGCTAWALYALDALPELPGLAREALAGVVSLTGDLVALERAADAAKYGAVSERPHVELHAPTLLWPSLAPEGRHVLVARIQYAPFHLRDGAVWDAARTDDLARRADAAIAAVAPGFAARVLHRVLWTPHDLERRFGLPEGAASQGEMSLDQILFMRPVAGFGRHATPIAGLYLGGAGTHPGPGVLGAPGWLAARKALADHARRAEAR